MEQNLEQKKPSELIFSFEKQNSKGCRNVGKTKKIRQFQAL